MDEYAIIETIFSYIIMFPSSFSIKYTFIWKNKLKELIKEIIKIDFLLTIFSYFLQLINQEWLVYFKNTSCAI